MTPHDELSHARGHALDLLEAAEFIRHALSLGAAFAGTLPEDGDQPHLEALATRLALSAKAIQDSLPVQERLEL